MSVSVRKYSLCLMFCLTAILSGCGGGSSTPTTTPSNETIFYSHNLVFKNISTLLSAGYNGFGQLGTGDLASRTSFGPLYGKQKFDGFATGGNFTVAFFNNSTVRTWGSNLEGQLGNNGATSSSSYYIPGAVFRTISTASGRNTPVNLSGIKGVAAGAYHALAWRNDDTVWSWGSNEKGQLGVINIASSFQPKMVTGVSGGSPFINISSITANSKLSMVRANGEVYAWGENTNGQTGRPASTKPQVDPKAVSGLPAGSVSSIAAGGGFGCAVVSGNVYCWGGNYNGQLGNKSNFNSYIPVQVLKDDGTPLTGIVQVSAGIQHALARDASGKIWGWGYNHFGQLGNGLQADSNVAVAVITGPTVTNPVALTGAVDIRAFGSSSLAKIGSDWYVWGDNSFGQLGLSNVAKVVFPTMLSGL